MRIALTSLYVENTEKAFAFYTGVLGFVEKMHMPEAELAIVASSEDADGPGLMLEPNSNPIASTYQKELFAAGIPVMIFGVEDIQSEYMRLKERGVVFRGEPKKTDWGMQTLFEDSCGNLIQLHQI
jgi:predicted enzyme related to lactoylglutathione lyase